MPAVELSFTAPARRRVHPTRRDPGEPTPGAAQSLLDARKCVLHAAGASPRADGPIDDRNPYYSTPGGCPEYLIARKLRRFLAVADEPSFEAARALAERLLAAEGADPWLLPAMAYVFPDTPAWADRAVAA